MSGGEHPTLIALVRRQLAARRLVLFTGAGFSNDARDRDGAPIPTARQLRRELWALCFPHQKQDGSSLADLFHHAMSAKPRAAARLIERRLRVDPSSLRPHHRLWFALPWRRVYTLNVDDLAVAVARRFGRDQRIETISALHRRRRRRKQSGIEMIHLNGLIDDGPEGMTFSTIQYGERLAHRCDYYKQLVDDLRDHPFLFVGTQLGEAPLWQHVEMMRARKSLRRRRPRSLLVAERLDRARRSLLRELAIDWIPMTARAFATKILSRVDLAA